MINLRVNNRTHRKLVVIDGQIGYIGGFNVGDDYLGGNPKFGYWRDTHLRVTGSAVSGIEQRLLTDWNAAADPADRWAIKEGVSRLASPLLSVCLLAPGLTVLYGWRAGGNFDPRTENAAK